jgi:acyl-CoA oxidase
MLINMSARLSILSNHLSQPKFLQDPLDFARLKDLIPPEINTKREQLRHLLDTEIAPLLPDYIERAEFPRFVIPKLKGIFGTYEGRYGCPKLTALEKNINIFELGRVDASLTTYYAVLTGLVIPTIELLGSEEQKAKWLPGLCSCDVIGCWGLTEPKIGSDASSLETTATPSDGGFIINGEKRWIGNAAMSDIMIIWARNTVSKEVEGFIVPTKTPGVSVNTIQRKLALRMVQNGHIRMENVKVPINARLEKARNFETGPNAILDVSRHSVPWLAAGAIAGMYENCVKYIMKRTQFGRPIAAYQLSQEKLVRILGHFHAVFLMCWRLADLQMKGQSNIAQSSMVKAWTSRIGREVGQLGRELLGGNGILIEEYAIKMMADMEVIHTYEGTYDINTLVVGRAITGIAAFKAPSGPKKS